MFLSQGFCDARNEVEFFRPMREFVDKEVAYLAKFLNVDSVSIPSLSTKVIIYQIVILDLILVSNIHIV